jgi:hypothetical protein
MLVVLSFLCLFLSALACLACYLLRRLGARLGTIAILSIMINCLNIRFLVK